MSQERKFEPRVLRVSTMMLKIPEISVGNQMEMSVSFQSNRNIQTTCGGDPLGLVGLKLSVAFSQTGSLPYFSSADITYVGNSGKN